MRLRANRWLWLAFISALIAIAFALISALYWWRTKHPPASQTAPPAPPALSSGASSAPSPSSFPSSSKPGASLSPSLRGFVEPPATYTLRAPCAGVVLALLAPEGQPVAQGQQLLQLDSPALRRELSSARQEWRRLRALQAKALDPAFQKQLEQAEGFYEEMTERLQHAEVELHAFEKSHPEVITLLETYQQAKVAADKTAQAVRQVMAEFNQAQEQAIKTGQAPPNFRLLAEKAEAAQKRNAEAQLRFEQARAARQERRHEVEQLDLLRRRVASARAILKRTQASLARLHARPEYQLLQQGRERLRRAEAHVKTLETAVAALVLRAPAAGVLEAWTIRPGQHVARGQILGRLRDLAGPRLVFITSVEEARRLAIGMKASVRLPNGSVFEATVCQIAPEPSRVRIYLAPRQNQPLPPPHTPLVAQF